LKVIVIIEAVFMVITLSNQYSCSTSALLNVGVRDGTRTEWMKGTTPAPNTTPYHTTPPRREREGHTNIGA
jgi:hypothetical protein